MKATCIILLIFVILPHAWGADQVSIEDFKRITNPDERRTIIRQAPPEQREELKKIDLHLALLARWGGEDGFKATKETCIVRARGLGSLEDIFGVEGQIWTGYASGVLTADDKAGMPPEKRMDVEKKLTEEEDVRSKRLLRPGGSIFGCLSIFEVCWVSNARAHDILQCLPGRMVGFFSAIFFCWADC
jgi:hypothetical protein